MDYTDIIVKKPWGYEYLCYRNKDIAIWFLHIEKDKKTSMHCHPNKNTGFVVLNGGVELSFLRNSVYLESLSKIHIFRSRFHSTKAVSDNGAFIFEIETPEDKHDLVRLEDEYGRVGVEYEGKNFHVNKTNECVWIDEASTQPKPLKLQNCIISHLSIKDKNVILNRSESELFIITSGGLVTDKNQKVVWPGDVIDGKTLHRLASSFNTDENTSMIMITK
jgi:mannose-6-phosphate isomerase-like protein (cupin superfamily)